MFFAIPNIPKAFPWLNFLPRDFTPLYGLYHREVLGAAEGSREDAESWKNFCRYLKERGLRSAKLIVSDKSLGILEALGEFFPEAHWQRCAVHFYRNVLNAVPASKSKKVAAMLKAIHAQEDREAARVKVKMVTEKLKEIKLEKAAALVV